MFSLPHRGNGLVGVGVSFVDVLILQEVVVSRLFRIVPFFAAAAAAVALIFSAQVGAQLQSGPLWWVPDNDTDWSRHHDRWLISPVEVVAAGAATSFPARTWVSSEQLGYLATAPPNSACDYLNETEYDVVGPPDLDRQDSMRTSRTPMHLGRRRGSSAVGAHRRVLAGARHERLHDASVVERDPPCAVSRLGPVSLWVFRRAGSYQLRRLGFAAVPKHRALDSLS